MQRHAQALIDRRVGDELAIAATHVRMPGVHHLPTDEPHEVFAYTSADAAWVRAPASVRDRLPGLTPAAVVDPSTWADVLGARVRRTLGPTVHAYTTVEPAAFCATVTSAVPAEIEALREAVSPGEWRESGFGGPVDEVFVVVEGGRPLAAANLTDWAGVPADVGVLVHPQARGRGLAVTVGAAATRAAVRAYGCARWRAFDPNHASRAVARRLGYFEDGRSLMVTLAD